MSYILSTGLGIPTNELTQSEVKELVPELFPTFRSKMGRLLSIFDHSHIERRQIVVEKEWFKSNHSFSERNDIYIEQSIQLSSKAIKECLSNNQMLTEQFPIERVDMLLFVSSSGISTPSIDAYLMNELPFRSDVVRMPLWGLGCAGGAMALSRAHEWLQANPDKNGLIVSSELCSLTFQKNDQKMSNLVGTALFGDGVSATLMIGEKSKETSYIRTTVPKIVYTDSRLEKGTLDTMGWNVTNEGFEVIFSKRIPTLVDSIWKYHVKDVLKACNYMKSDISSWILHPGGRKVIEEMKLAFDLHDNHIQYSVDVLREHGNMSSTTIFYILKRWLEQSKNEGTSILSSLGPGFSSEILLLDWVNVR